MLIVALLLAPRHTFSYAYAHLCGAWFSCRVNPSMIVAYAKMREATNRSRTLTVVKKS